MIRAKGCHSTILYSLKNEDPKIFDEDIHVYGLDTIFHTLQRTMIEHKLIPDINPLAPNIDYDVDSGDNDYFEGATIPNNNNDYEPEEITIHSIKEYTLHRHLTLLSSTIVNNTHL